MSENTEKEIRGFGRKMTKSDKVWLVIWIVGIVLFALWMGSFVPFLVLPFVADVYWTRFIKWDWWKGIKNGFLRGVMSWVDAIVFALAAVWVLQNFFFQNFQIPTTSLEKTMMAGDYLLVSKYHYGPRVPMTPLSLPLFQHTVSIGSTRFGKSYIDHPQVNYRRMPGLTKMERYDIVVFNYPNGDTVCVNCENPDYYTLCKMYGRDRVWSDKKTFGEVIARPVDRRENYVKRLVGMPGETLQIIDRKVLIDGKELKDPQYLQHKYIVLTKGGVITEREWKKMGVYTKGSSNGSVGADVTMIQDAAFYQYYDIKPDSITGRYAPLYLANLTREMVEKLEKSGKVEWVKDTPYQEAPGTVYPQDELSDWTGSDFGPLWIPQKGKSIRLTDENVKLYGRCIRVYEPNQATGDGQGNELVRLGKDKYQLNGKEASEFTFGYDYYWMMGDNRDNSLDSRYWGFVPEDHIVGTPLFVWFSINQETGEWRKDRWLKKVKGL
jgi:signal peptidase I